MRSEPSVYQFLFCLLISVIPSAIVAQTLPSSQRSRMAEQRCENKLEKVFEAKGQRLGEEIFVRIFKESGEFEIWVKTRDSFSLFKTYPICFFSGALGTKTKVGDRQSPEGFYFVRPRDLNPYSNFHLSFNIGYPNNYDRAHGYTGSLIMIHGGCVSIGCFAMGDENIEEIWTIISKAFQNGQQFFRLHIFPFRMSGERLDKEKTCSWYSFWNNLKEGYNWFEQKRIPPNVEVKDKRYVFN